MTYAEAVEWLQDTVEANDPLEWAGAAREHREGLSTASPSALGRLLGPAAQ